MRTLLGIAMTDFLAVERLTIFSFGQAGRRPATGDDRGTKVRTRTRLLLRTWRGVGQLVHERKAPRPFVRVRESG